MSVVPIDACARQNRFGPEAVFGLQPRILPILAATVIKPRHFSSIVFSCRDKSGIAPSSGPSPRKFPGSQGRSSGFARRPNRDSLFEGRLVRPFFCQSQCR